MPRLLIVEDQLGLREILRTIFEDEYEVRTAADGVEALAILAAWWPEVMITDYAMPGMTGLELVQAIRKKDDVGARRAVPLRNNEINTILLSACLMDEIRQEAAALGVAACVEKPFDLETLRGMVRGLCG